ncbi:MAG: DNA-3-methyladenine glycosylase 2 family protein [Candidatus Brennerbacteria bacterium]|nr:DNA-3-methyladenine glycosylase 2 family protein [Candidatus Brennerbacteria bacterium]
MSYHTHLSKVDKVMARLVKRYPLKPIRPAMNPLEELVGSIISQQLSVKAANTIAARFIGLYGTRMPSAARIVKTPVARMRKCGISNAKARYLKNVARAFLKGHLNRTHLMRMSDAEVHTRLLAIKGVGPWTVEMFLIFALGRPDLFSPGDVGLQNAIRARYGKEPTPAFMKKLSARWAPYRSYACRYLWKSQDNE